MTTLTILTPDRKTGLTFKMPMPALSIEQPSFRPFRMLRAAILRKSGLSVLDFEGYAAPGSLESLIMKDLNLMR